MLTHLVIKNYALIKHLEIHPGLGLNIITGETGAGKSIMLGALGLLMGNRADTKALFDENEKCFVEGSFDVRALHIKSFFETNDLDFEDQCLIRREIAPGGKSRAFVNDSPVTLDVLKALGVLLMDIHSQHDTFMLSSQLFQLNLLDIYANNQDLLSEYKQAFVQFREADKNLKDLQFTAQSLKKEHDLNTFLFQELETAKLVGQELPSLEEELLILENAEEVKKKLSLGFEYLSNPDQAALVLLKEAGAAINSISNISEKYKELYERIKSSIIELQDVAAEIETTESKLETNEPRAIELRDRINLIYKLLQKHTVKTEEELISLQNELDAKIQKVTNLDDELKNLQNELEVKHALCIKIATSLSENRKKIVTLVSKKIEDLLIELGIHNAQLQFSINEKPLTENGFDEAQLLFSANKGSVLKPLKDVASGGEFSRLMLAIKYVLAEKRSLPTIIFDEIDTGVSGEVAIKVGNILSQMAKNLQVIVITHLHQIAGRGQKHFFVYKDDSETKTMSRMKVLDGNERILEVAKMIGGQNPSESAIASAIEMLEFSK